jgi:hypothetical protein
MKKITVSWLLILIGTITFAQTITVSGTVTDEGGKPVPFAFVKDAEHNYATFSDPDGAFTLNADPSSRLMATCNNYKESVVKIDNQPSVKIVMTPGGTAGASAASLNKSADAFNVHEIGMKDTRASRPLARFGSSQEELHGSPYLFNNWVHGFAISTTDSINENDSYLFNYEKISGALLYTDGGEKMYMVDRTQIKGFTIFDEKGQPYTFENVPSIDPKHYLQVLASGSKYKIYKDLQTKFLKADFQTNGITSSGNNYDSYVDEGDYYVVKLPGGQPQKISLKRKSIRTAFGADADKANKFMSAHDSDDVDDTFLKGLGEFMND